MVYGTNFDVHLVLKAKRTDPCCLYSLIFKQGKPTNKGY